MKPALPGQFVLFVSSQSKENALKYFCLFRCAAQNKNSDFWAAQKYFIICEQHKFLIFVSFIARNWLTLGSKKLNYRAAQNAWFSEGIVRFLSFVVRFLSFLCRSSPDFDPKMGYSWAAWNKNIIHEQHEIGAFPKT